MLINDKDKIMIRPKIWVLMQVLCFLFIASSNTHACHKDDSEGTCSAVFYDFEKDEGLPEIVEWEKDCPFRHHYRNKRPEHFGAVLISHGWVASPVGYGEITIIKDEKFDIEKYCPSCSTKYETFEGCAFNNCYYMIRGEKVNGDYYATAWRKVEDYLNVFHNVKKMANFRHLVFEVRYLNDPPPKKPSFF